MGRHAACGGNHCLTLFNADKHQPYVCRIHRVSTSSALVFTFVANDVTAQDIDPANYVEMSSLWGAAGLQLGPEAYSLYTDAFTGMLCLQTNASSMSLANQHCTCICLPPHHTASEAPDLPGEFQPGTPMVVTDYLRRFARFQNVASSKQQCTGLTGCYQYVSGSGQPNVVVCAGTC